MRQPYLLVCSILLLSCSPDKPFQPPNTSKGKSSATAQPLGSDAIPSGEAMLPPEDPEEEEKAMEPAIIGGAYLYCDADQIKSEGNPSIPMIVGCRVGNVNEIEWNTANKNMKFVNRVDGADAPGTLTTPGPGSPYHILFEANRSMQNNLELHVDVMLAQGPVQMSTTVNPNASKAIEQRLGKGLALYTSTGTAGDWSGTDRKTWNLWMPLQIPSVISNFNSSGKKTQGTVTLSFDDTVCIYQSSTSSGKSGGSDDWYPNTEDYRFISCTRNWQPGQWVRSKSISLQMILDANNRSSMAAGVVLKTSP